MNFLKIYFSILIFFLIVDNNSYAQIKDSLKPAMYYFENGQVSSEGFLREGKPDGYWKSYYPNGKIKTEGNRKNYLLDGVWKFYTEEGMLYLTIDYVQDKKQGNRITYRGKQIYKKEQFKEDAKNGLSEVFYPDGKIKSQTPFVNGREKGLAYEYDTTGLVVSLLTYKAGVLVKEQQINRYDKNNQKKGIWMQFHINRSVKNEGMYVNDLKHGYWKYFNSNGNLIRIEKWVHGVLVKDADELAKIDIRREIDPNTGKIKYMGGYRNGKKEGVHREYDENGRVINSQIYKSDILLAEGIYDEQGRKQGLWKYFRLTGELKETGKYKNDKKIGIWKYFFLNGEIEQVGEYVMDLPEGVWRWYYESGDIRLEEEYIDGFEDGPSTEYADSTHKIIARGTYIEGFKDGQWEYFIGDTKLYGKYYEGEKQGYWRMVNMENGKTLFEGEYLNGIENGNHRHFYTNGIPKSRGRYSLGLRDGLWEFLDAEGNITMTIRYDQGKEIEYNGVKISYGKRVDRELEEEEQAEDIQQ